MQRTLLALALIVTAGASYAQTMPTAEPSDPYGRPLIGRNDWVRQPGDQAGPGVGNPNMAAVPMPQVAPRQIDRMPAQSGPRGAAMKDEFGFRYDAQGNRLDARGNIISPQTR